MAGGGPGNLLVLGRVEVPQHHGMQALVRQHEWREIRQCARHKRHERVLRRVRGAARELLAHRKVTVRPTHQKWGGGRGLGPSCRCVAGGADTQLRSRGALGAPLRHRVHPRPHGLSRSGGASCTAVWESVCARCVFVRLLAAFEGASTLFCPSVRGPGSLWTWRVMGAKTSMHRGPTTWQKKGPAHMHAPCPPWRRALSEFSRPWLVPP